MKYVGITVAVIVLALGLGWVLQGNDFFLYKAFAPRYEQVRRETFEQSHAYRQGMIQELQNMQFQYIQADPAHRAGLASIILHRVDDVPDAETLPRSLQSFIGCLRGSQATGFATDCSAA